MKRHQRKVPVHTFTSLASKYPCILIIVLLAVFVCSGLTYIVFGITFCYFVCCILPTVYMISAIASDTSSDQTSIFIFNAGETTLVINAATDFFFYCLLGRKFRRVFMRTFCPQRYLKKTKVLTMRTTVSYNSV